ncbi:MAG TPA: CocE/NonD family hydrolase [Candidatus Sulfomarinibacteraceae bacterium]|nr:CocE/NonD family hydrolase [Candidatus Sulfomarinibacteraceae bacterium]
MTTMIRRDYPCAVRKIDNTWITMADGARLATSVWLPEDAESAPVPAILEYLPYRKDDSRAVRDSTYLPYFAGHGYACVRVDMRGTGNSDGILYDEYLPQEQDDALEVLAWIAAQPWCTGDAGIIGISWGGFNGLQIAARRPSQLKAIITVASTDDRYADDVHYRGGCLLASDQLPWASRMLLLNALPPDPRIVGERWREMWFNRLEKTPPYVEAWLKHQTRDDFWKHGSVCENYADIECAVYAIGGWNDAYTNAIPRLLAGLQSPKKGLIGPWSHGYPYVSHPGPQIGFLQECLRWWDYWLKGQDNGIMDEPLLRAWIQESVRPAPHYDERPGYWVAEREWPSPDVQTATYRLDEGGALRAAVEEVADAQEVTIRGSQFNGSAAGLWCPYGQEIDLPFDQQEEDGLSLLFTSAPVEADTVLLGNPVVRLTLAADQPEALVVARLCDVSPSGNSLLVSRGFLNLTHRDSHEQPQALQPGTFYEVTMTMDVAGHRLPAGHRWRLAISPTYWPMAWPSPRPVTLRLRTGTHSRLQLPLREPKAADATLADFPRPEQSEPIPYRQIRPATRERHIRRDVGAGKQQIQDVADNGHVHLLDRELEMKGRSEERFTIYEDDPLSATIVCEQHQVLRRGEWDVRVETYSEMSADEQQFHVINVVDAYEGNTRVFNKTWSTTIPRHHV